MTEEARKRAHGAATIARMRRGRVLTPPFPHGEHRAMFSFARRVLTAALTAALLLGAGSAIPGAATASASEATVLAEHGVMDGAGGCETPGAGPCENGPAAASCLYPCLPALIVGEGLAMPATPEPFPATLGSLREGLPAAPAPSPPRPVVLA